MWELSAVKCTSNYKTKTTIETLPASTVPGSCTLTAVETAAHVYTGCRVKHCEQSVCISLTQFCLHPKKLMGPCFLTILDTSNIEGARAFPSFFHGQSINSLSA
jgi:hypothetical protein